MAKKLIITIICIAIFLYVIELTIRFVYNNFYVSHRHLFESPINEALVNRFLVYDPDLFWRFNPQLHQIKSCFLKDGKPIIYSFNSKGLRGKEFSARKNKDIFRIICIGNSNTFGWWVDDQDTYPQQLEDILNTTTNHKKKFEVINAGILGYTSFQGLKFLNRDILANEPDLIIAYFGPADASSAFYFDKEIKNTQLLKLQYLLNQSFIYQLANRLVSSWMKSILAHYSNLKVRVTPEDYFANCKKMKELCFERGIKILFVRPIYFNYGSICKITEYQRPFMIDIYSVLKEKNKENELSFDDVHPTPAGYRIIAETIYKAVMERKVLSD